MGAKSHIKNSVLYTLSSLKLLSFVFLGSIIVAKHCSSSEGESEKRDGHQRLNSIPTLEEKMPLDGPISEEELRYDESLLGEADKQMLSVIHDFVNLSGLDFVDLSIKQQEYFKELQEKYIKEATEEHTKTVEALTNYLGKRALEAVSEKPILIAHLEKPSYDDSLLKKVSVARATDQMNFIIDFVSLYTDQQKYFKGLQRKYKKEAAKEQIKTAEALTNYLGKRALQVLSEKPTVMAYLKGLREKNEEAIDLSKRLLAHCQLLLESHQSQSKTIKNLSEQVTMQQKKIDELSGENELKSETIGKFSEQITTYEKKIDALSRENELKSETIDELSQKLKAQSEQRVEKQEKIEEFSRNIPLQSETVANIPAQSRAEHDIVEASQKSEYFQKYMVPIAAFTLGTSVATIGILGYYRFTKPI